MDETAQAETIAFLSRPEAYGPGVDSVERIDTHGAAVFLAGDRAYKLKRAVRFAYMDFSTVALRRAACEAELRLNRRTAPEIYERVAAVVRRGPGLAIDGPGEAVDWLVVMHRFAQELLFDRLAAAGGLTVAMMTDLAEHIAAFHAAAERVAGFGGASGIEWVIGVNRAGLAAAADLLDPSLAAEIEAGCRAGLARIAAALEARREAGFVRRCHGDLHLGNIFLFKGRPTLFDAVEFNDQISCIDTLYDFAFLIMDLERRGLQELASAAFNRYLEASADYRGLVAWPLFLACRAAVRAQTRAAAARVQAGPGTAGAPLREARASLGLARDFLRPAPPRLIAIGGLSGTGKSTLARALAPEIGAVPGAVVLRSDVIRKRLAGVAQTDRLGPQWYGPEVSERVYDAMRSTAGDVLDAGHAAIADAVFGRPAERWSIERIARERRVPFIGLWLDLPVAEMERRVAGRTRDASDADVAVVREQMHYDTGPIEWRRIDASGGLDRTLALARAQLI